MHYYLISGVEMKKFSLLLKQQIKINTLQNELDTLKRHLKDGMYGNFMIYANNSEEIEYLRKENKRLRLKNKELKEMLNNETTSKKRK